MNRYILRLFPSVTFLLSLAVSVLLFAGVQARAQCTEVAPGLQIPLGITQSNQGNLLVSESGTRTANTGRISIIDLDGNRRTLLGGLPSGINDVGEVSGPAGLFLHGRTLYVAIGVGDSLLPGPIPNTDLSSPIFSSVLAIHFSAHVEKTTEGFTLTSDDHDALDAGQKVTLSNGVGDRVTIELIANFPNSTEDPTSASGFRNTNPFDLVVVGDQVYVTDGGQNMVWQVDIPTGTFSTLVTFPRVDNPFFGTIGGPRVDAVPTGIRYFDGQLLVTLFRGFPFPPVSTVEQIDPSTGIATTLIGGRKTAIDVLPITTDGDTDYLVLQHASAPGPFGILGGPGLLLRFETPTAPPTVIASCLTRPTSMTLDKKSGTLYITELGPLPPGGPGRVVSIAIAP